MDTHNSECINTKQTGCCREWCQYYFANLGWNLLWTCSAHPSYPAMLCCSDIWFIEVFLWVSFMMQEIKYKRNFCVPCTKPWDCFESGISERRNYPSCFARSSSKLRTTCRREDVKGRSPTAVDKVCGRIVLVPSVFRVQARRVCSVSMERPHWTEAGFINFICSQSKGIRSFWRCAIDAFSLQTQMANFVASVCQHKAWKL